MNSCNRDEPAPGPPPASPAPATRRLVHIAAAVVTLALAGQLWWSQFGELRRSIDRQRTSMQWPDVGDAHYPETVAAVAERVPPGAPYLHLASWPRERRLRFELFDRITYTGSKYLPLHDAEPNAIIELMARHDIPWLLVDTAPSPHSPYPPPPEALLHELACDRRLHPVDLGSAPAPPTAAVLFAREPQPRDPEQPTPGAAAPPEPAPRRRLAAPGAYAAWLLVLLLPGAMALADSSVICRERGTVAVRIATVMLAGGVLLHLAAQLLTLAGIPLTLRAWIAAAVFLAILLRGALALGSARSAAETSRADSPATPEAGAALPGLPPRAALWIVIALQLGYVLLLTAVRPLEDGDALADWVYKARVFEQANAIRLAPEGHSASTFHAYYPTLIPALGALHLQLGDAAHPEQLRWHGVFWLALLLAGLDGIARRAGAGGHLRVALLALFLASGHLLYEHASTAMADLPLAAAVALLLAHLSWPGNGANGQAGSSALGGAIAFAAACSCKLEGTPQAAALLLPLLATDLRGGGLRRAARTAAPLACAATTALAPWLLLLLRSGVAFDSEHVDQIRLTGLPRILGALVAAPFHPYYWGVLAPVALILWGAHRAAGARPVPRWTAAALALEAAMIAGAYLLTSYHGPQLAAQIGYTLNRLYLHVLPLAWAALSYLARPTPRPDRHGVSGVG